MINKSQLTSEFIKRYQNTDGTSKYSKKKLGQMLHHEYPDLFKDSEAARFHIRIITDAAGIKSNKKVDWKGVQLPKPEKNDFSKVIVNQKRIAFLSDIHFPYHDEEALTAALIHVNEWNPDCLLLGGDIIDCYHLSNFEKDKRQRSFKYELDILKSFFIQIRDQFPKIRIIYKIGNHEERYEKQILQNIPELIELEYFHFENVIEASKYGIEVVKNKRIIKAGRLNICHGHELPRGMAAPVNPARGFFLRTKSSTIGGHHHQSSEHVENNLNGEIIGAWSVGCLCDLYPHYMPINKWNHGFALIENYGDDFRVDNKKIIKGKVL